MILPMHQKSLREGLKAKAKHEAKINKKNCENCVHLSYEHGDVNDPEGFTCLKRLNGSETQKQEADLHRKLDSKEYRLKSKRCCDHKYTG